MQPFLDPVGEAAALIAEGKASEVVARAEALLAGGRGGALTRVALGQALTALGRAPEAVEVLREAVLLAPSSTDAALAMGRALAQTGALPTAIAEFQRALRIDPHCAAAHLEIAQMWLDAGEADKAEASLREAEDAGTSDEAITRLRTNVQAQRELKRAPQSYVRHLFDQFSADYDERMRGRLGYAAPEILRDLASLLLGPARKAFDILDIGCGTGLSGVAFAGYARRLVGVDLSPGMLAKAKALKIYNVLAQSDVEQLPAEASGPFDIAVAADVLCYLGDLSRVFAEIQMRLKPDGLWFFTSELLRDGTFELGPKRRYRHAMDYVRALADAHGFDVASLIECVVRHDAGKPVEGLAAALRLR